MSPAQGQQPSPFTTQHKPVPRWLREAAARLGPPEIDTLDGARRWLWKGGEVGVVVGKRSHTWQVVAFGPKRSVTLRDAVVPTDATIRAAVSLAGLAELGEDPWTAPLSGVEVR